MDYLQNPEVLISEFVESYYQIEGKLDPEREDEALAATQDEVVLEPFFDSLELNVRTRRGIETIRCAGGAFAPLPGELHPALEQQGVDYVGVRSGTNRVVLGVTDTSGEATVFALLMRGLNCLAELSPPFQLARLRRHVLKDRVTPEATFDLQLGIFQREHVESEVSLLMLTRDLAEGFKQRIEQEQQFSGTIGRIECLASGKNPPDPRRHPAATLARLSPTPAPRTRPRRRRGCEPRSPRARPRAHGSASHGTPRGAALRAAQPRRAPRRAPLRAT